MDDIKDPEGKDPMFDTSLPTTPPPAKNIGPESERRGGHEAEPDNDDDVDDDHTL